MDEATQALIRALHRSPYRYCLVATGGGARALAMLLDVPGGSRTILEERVPYGEASLNEFLGCPPEKYCSAATGRDLALRAYERAQWLAPGEPVIGLACTASLVSDRAKRGDHRVHISCASSGRLQSYTLVLIKQARSRIQEETVVDALILNALAAAAGVVERVEPQLLPGEMIDQEEAGQGDGLAALLSGEVAALRMEADGRIDNPERRPVLIVAGSFHPVHPGHWRLAEAGAALTGLPAEFELSVANVDKPALFVEEIRRRMRQFSWRAPLWLTRAPTFVEKARLFPGSVFAVGADTAMRIVAPRYYGSEEAVDAALDEVCKSGCRFLVAGRQDAAGHFMKLGELKIPDAWRELFQEIPESECCVPVSSTELRRAQEAASRAGQADSN